MHQPNFTENPDIPELSIKTHKNTSSEKTQQQQLKPQEKKRKRECVDK